MGLLPEGNVTTLAPESSSRPPATLQQAVIAAQFGTRQVSSLASEEHFSPPPFHERQSRLAASVSALSFDHGNWSQFNGLLADPSIMAGVYHVGHILVGLRSLFHNQFGRGNADCDSHICQFVQDILEI